MIRINLLPQTRRVVRAAAASSQGSTTPWVVAYLVGMFLWAVLLAGIYIYFGNQLEEQQQANAALEGRITELREKSASLDDIRAKLEASAQLESVVADLNRARLGPTRVLIELSRVLSRDGGPTIDARRLEQLRQENPLAGFNSSWDSRRLWLKSFEEEDRDCTILGTGKTNEDVAEFIRRLTLSEVFATVALQKTESLHDAESGLDLISFELACKVTY